MKNNLILILITIFVLGSCDFLDAPEPKSSIPLTAGITSLDGYTNLLYGSYDGLQRNATEYVKVNDIMGDDVQWYGTFPEFVQIANHDMNPVNFAIEDIWNRAYRSINIANIVINEAVGTIENASPSDIDNVVGQAYFIRALNYYYLVQFYSKPWGATADNSHLGVPIQLNAITDSPEFVSLARASVKDVYDQISDDLIAANGKITNTQPKFVSNNAVLAFQARIALIQSRWLDAASLANDVIPNYSLNDKVTDYFINEFGTESIFEIENTPQDNAGGGNYAIASVYNVQRRNEGRISDAYRDALGSIITATQKTALNLAGETATDTRITELLHSGEENPTSLADYTITKKYEDYINIADNAPMIRLSEMILTRAEALAEENGVNQPSIDLLNQIRNRAIKVTTGTGDPGNQSLIEYKLADFANKQELIDAILLERRVELAFEGHRKTDLQRRNLNVRNLAWNADKLVLPIPDSQINTESKIEQNPGY